MGVLVRRAYRAMSQSPGWLVLAVALETVFAVTAILAGHHLDLADLLAAGPLLASARCSGRTTALVTLYALALCAVVTVVLGTSSASSIEAYSAS